MVQKDLEIVTQIFQIRNKVGFIGKLNVCKPISIVFNFFIKVTTQTLFCCFIVINMFLHFLFSVQI